jgi:hypothetical protein
MTHLVQDEKGCFQGGSLLERLGKKLKIDSLYVKDGRSLNVGMTLQTIPSIAAPAAGGGKDDGPVGDENRQIRRQIAEVRCITYSIRRIWWLIFAI